MKKLLGFGSVLALITGVFATTLNAQTPLPAAHFYGVEHGIVEYAISGAAKGKETLYFDRWGMRQIRYKVSETQRWGTTSIVTLNLGTEIISFDPNKNLGQKKENHALKQILDNPNAQDSQLLSIETLKLAEGKKIKEETFLDRVCEVWETSTPKMDAWIFNGIVLKSQTTDTAQGTMIYTAVSLDTTTAIDEKVFEIPEKVRFIDRDINEILISQRI